jgi:FAD/FMN-containing dehydrogenase
MNKRGFGCDSIVNYEVVLANGSVINANRDRNKSLWKALKGGGPNFGIIYDLSYKCRLI